MFAWLYNYLNTRESDNRFCWTWIGLSLENNIFEEILRNCAAPGLVDYHGTSVQNFHLQTERIHLYSMILSFCAVFVDVSRLFFNNFIKSHIKKERPTAALPQNDACFDYYIDFDKLEWVSLVDKGGGTRSNETTANWKQLHLNTRVSGNFIKQKITYLTWIP